MNVKARQASQKAHRKIREEETLATRLIRFEDQNELRDLLAAELLSVCMSTLKKHGLAATQLARLAQSVVNGHRGIPASKKLFRDISKLSLLAAEWADNPAYVDASGRPKVLPIAGNSPSFTALTRQFFYRRTTDDVLHLAIAAKIVERVNSVTVAHLGTCVLLTGNPILLLGHAVRSVRWFLCTAYFNGQRKQPNAFAWPERQAFAELTEDDFVELVRFMREPIANLTEMCNRWLITKAKVKGQAVGRRRIVMGVEAYLFRDL